MFPRFPPQSQRWRPRHHVPTRPRWPRHITLDTAQSWRRASRPSSSKREHTMIHFLQKAVDVGAPTAATAETTTTDPAAGAVGHAPGAAG